MRKSTEEQKDRTDIEKLLSEEAKRLERPKPPDYLWKRIEARLMEEMEPKPNPIKELVRKLGDFLRGVARPIFGEGLGWRPVVAIATATVVLIALVLSLKSFMIPEDPLKVVEKAERKYIEAIEKLEVLASAKEADVNPTLWVYYQEKLALLDASIEECKEVLSINRYNTNARKYLLLAYKAKVETLKEIVQGRG